MTNEDDISNVYPKLNAVITEINAQLIVASGPTASI